MPPGVRGVVWVPPVTMSRVSRVLGWLVALGLALVALLGVILDGLGLTTTAPFAHVLAFRGVLGLASISLAVLLLLLAAPRPGGGRPGGAAIFLGLTLLVTGLVHAGTVVSRGVQNEAPTAAHEADGLVTVLALNTLDGAASPEDVAEVAAALGVDVLALPETPVESARLVAELLAERGTTMQVFADDHGRRHRATALLVSESLGRYQQVENPGGEGMVRVESVDGSAPPLVAVHVRRPGQGTMSAWVHGLRTAVASCRETPGAVVAGDFNATLDHGPMRSLGPCVDAAAAAGFHGSGAYGTWHTALPALMGAPIDHVLADGGYWSVAEATVAAIGSSDHRAVLARLQPVGTYSTQSASASTTT